jgi:hypothetical protein
MKTMTAETRQRVNTMRDGLLRLHKLLMESERASYEKDVEKITSTGQYLNLVLNDPWFDWLRELSQFIVIVDETLAAKEPATDEEGLRLIAQARALIVPDENGERFARGYWQAMQRDPDNILAHRDMMEVFKAIG